MESSNWGLPFEVSAPGKVILHGEHSVVHGGTALAASLGLRTKLQVLQSPHAMSLHVDFPDVNLKREYSIEIIKRLILDTEILREIPSLPKNEDIPLEASLALINGLNTNNHSEPLGPQQDIALSCFFHLILCAGREIISNNDKQKKLWPIVPAATFHIETNLPVGAGAGSSAAFCVCLAAGTLHLAHALVNGNVTWGFDGLTDNALLKVSCLANSGERLMHGRPSGVDSAVCTYGGVVKFKSGQVESIGQVPLKVLLVDSGVDRQTKAMVAAVHMRLEQFPEVVSCILEAMDKLTLQALELLRSLINTPNDPEIYLALEDLLDINQGLLWSLGVSHPSLDKILSLGASIANLHGKLTGAGGGGLAYLLLTPGKAKTSEIKDSDLEKLNVCLAEYGYHSKEVELGGPGIKLSTLAK